jgi:hypothetical protein
MDNIQYQGEVWQLVEQLLLQRFRPIAEGHARGKG